MARQPGVKTDRIAGDAKFCEPVIRAITLLALASAVPATAQDDPLARGEQHFAWCYACHSVTPGEDGLQGPNLAGIVGSRVGSRPGFSYTDAFIRLREAGVVWTAEALDAFLADPLGFAPGNAMGPLGVPDAEDRADLIAYLEALSGESR